MQYKAILKVFGLLLVLFSQSLVPPMVISLFTGDGAIGAFLVGYAVTFGSGLIVWWPLRKFRGDLRIRDGFLLVAFFWLILGLFGAVPLALSSEPGLSITDAVFESVSGLTTTGATIITGLDNLPKSILIYRQQLQWLGGMGVIVLAVAVMPMLGVGGMQLYKAEIPGPMKNNRLTSRIAETAKALWYIYLGLTIACALAYWLAGMSPFDAIGHSFSTIAIGGFSTHDTSMAFFDNPLIESIAIVFMLVAGINFSLHFVAWHDMGLRHYWEDAETRTYIWILGVLSVVCIVYLGLTHAVGDIGQILRHGLFQVVSVGTTAGFTTAPFYLWPGALPVILLFSSFIGGCAGSTGGGMKVIRVLLLYKQGQREVKRLVHPNAVIAVKVGSDALPSRVVESVWGFFALYAVAFVIIFTLVLMTGLDQVSAFSAVAACMNNLGPGLGVVGPHYADISDFAKWLLCLAMVVGRLEVFTVLVLFTRAFWRSY